VEAAPRREGTTRGGEASGGWQRIEDRGGSTRERFSPETNERRGGDAGAVFSRERSEPRSEPVRYEPTRSQRYEAPRTERREAPRFDRGGGGEGRVSPPIVHERSAPRYEAPRGTSRAPEARGGGEVRSAPRGDSGGGRSAPRGDSGGGRGGRGR
jgi:hypothetical protein